MESQRKERKEGPQMKVKKKNDDSREAGLESNLSTFAERWNVLQGLSLRKV